MVIKPLLTATALCSKRAEYMTDNFYVNGSVPPVGSVPQNKPYSKDLRSRLSVFAVSDGIGQNEYAGNAAYKVLSILKKYHEKLGTVTVETINTVTDAYTEEANSYLQTTGQNQCASLAMLIINHGVAIAINSGNARVYSFKYGHLNRLSIDDTETEHLLNIGAIRREEAKDHPSRRNITAAIGSLNIQAGQKMHMSSPMPVENGDVFLISSNGITDYLSDDRISYILSLRMSNERLAQRLVSEAIARGADDNLSVILVRSGKNQKKSRVNKGLVKVGTFVILLAVLSAYFISCAWKKAPSGEATPTPPVTPSPTPVSVLGTPMDVNDDDFQLRE